MNWTRSELFLMAQRSCALCGGSGSKNPLKPEPSPCGCVYRAAFRVSFERFKSCVERGRHVSHVTLERAGMGKSNRAVWSRKEEEYIADFELVSRRYLDEWHHRLFRFYFILGADWKLCARRLGVARGNLFHAVYRVEERLGRVFSELEPYALYPPRDYFAVRSRQPVRPFSAGTFAAPVTKIPRPVLYGRLSEGQMSA